MRRLSNPESARPQSGQVSDVLERWMRARLSLIACEPTTLLS